MADRDDKHTPAGEDTQAFEPVQQDDTRQASGDETKTFAALHDGAGPDATKVIDISGTDTLLERCERRGSVRDYTAGSLIWRILKPLLILAVSVILVAWLGFTAYHFVEDNYFKPVSAEPAETQTVTISQGSSLSKIASILYDLGLVRNKLVFQMYVDLNDMGSSLVAGTYELSPSMTMDEIMGILAEGNPGREIVTITLTEGMTARDMADSLLSNGVFDTTEKFEFLALCNDADAYSDYSFIAALEDSDRLDGRKYLLEGYLFPTPTRYMRMRRRTISSQSCWIASTRL